MFMMQFKFPTTVPGVGQFRATAANELQDRVRTVTANLSRSPVPAAETFDDRIRRAVANRPRTTFGATSTDDPDDFREKLKRAVDRLPTSRKAAGERAAKERSRYRKPQPRQRCKGE